MISVSSASFLLSGLTFSGSAAGSVFSFFSGSLIPCGRFFLSSFPFAEGSAAFLPRRLPVDLVRSYGILSDMFGRYSVEHGGVSQPFGFGHKPDYVKKAGNLSAESFANLTAGEITNKDAVELVKKYLPDSYDAFLQILEGM